MANGEALVTLAEINAPAMTVEGLMDGYTFALRKFDAAWEASPSDLVGMQTWARICGTYRAEIIARGLEVPSTALVL